MKNRRSKPLPVVPARLQKIVGGGQTMGELEDSKKVFVWGGLPGETVQVQLTKSKSSMAEGIVTEVVQASLSRQQPQDPSSYLSTSPWQIMPFENEQATKQALINEAFALHHVAFETPEVYTDNIQYGYRNKVEFSWWWEHGTEDDDEAAGQLDLAFFKRGSHGKQPVEGTSLARPQINDVALAIRDLLRGKDVGARSLKTLLIRCDRDGACVWQLYVKDKLVDIISEEEAAALPARGGEVIYSDPKSPASRITERLAAFGDVVLHDSVLDVPFSYATEGFFQVNIPVYEQALHDMQPFVGDGPTLDLYSGVGSIGLTIGGRPLTLVEIDKNAFREMESNIADLADASGITPVLAPSEKALEAISGEATVIVDPPRAGLHQAVVDRLLETKPRRIVYLSCNPVTQARDAVLLFAGGYRIAYARGYNFFPRTPHIEHLIVLEAK